MAITIQIPPDIEQELRRQIPNLDESTREQFLVSNYQAGKLSTGDIAEILGFETRQEAQSWLAQRNIPINYTLAALEEDRKNLKQLFGAE
jgi:predicted HTH domain antitoxin